MTQSTRYNFTKQTAIEVLSRLDAHGYTIGPGLSDNEIETVEKAFNAPLPPDFKVFLRAGVITAAPPITDPRIISGESFPDWRNPKEEASKNQEYIERIFINDIENGYWSEQLGTKPLNLKEATEQAITTIRTWPPLFRIHSHRFIPSSPSEMGNPVLSIWQPGDTIYYGENLLRHLDIDFKLGLNVPKSEIKSIPHWGKAFGLE